jgi:hypothetical protein
VADKLTMALYARLTTSSHFAFGSAVMNGSSLCSSVWHASCNSKVSEYGRSTSLPEKGVRKTYNL